MLERSHHDFVDQLGLDDRFVHDEREQRAEVGDDEFGFVDGGGS